MPITLTTDAVAEIVLTAEQRQDLMLWFGKYQKIKLRHTEMTKQLEEIKEKIAAIREDVGVESVSLNGYRTSIVAPVRGVFNKELFIAEGGDLSVYNRSVELRPTKSYELITLPDDK